MNQKNLMYIMCLCLAGGCLSCSDGDKSDGCTANTGRCDGSDLNICVNGSWELLMTCGGDTPVCDASALNCVSSDQPPCSPGDSKCGAGNMLSICGADGTWLPAVPCTGNMPVCGLTPEGRPGCIAISGECLPGETKCEENNKLHMCGSDGLWGESVICSGDTPVCGTTSNGVPGCIALSRCTPGDTKCESDSILVECDDSGKWGKGIQCAADAPQCGLSSDGEYGCIASEKCSQGEKKCVSEHEISTCDASGAWVTETCGGNTPVCGIDADQKTACVQPSYECSQGETKCDSASSIRTCGADRKWGDPVTCAAPFTVCGQKDGKDQCIADAAMASCTVAGKTVPHGTKFCGNKGDLMMCNDGKYKLDTQCSALNPCDPVKLQCAKPDDTELNSIRAVRNAYATVFKSEICKDYTPAPTDVTGRITGIVSWVDHSGHSIFIQDQEAGIRISCKEDSFCEKNVTMGDKVSVEFHQLGGDKCDLRIIGNKNNMKITRVDNKKHDIEPVMLDDQDFEAIQAGNTNSQHMHMLVALKNVTLKNRFSATYDAKDAAGHRITYRGYFFGSLQPYIKEKITNAELRGLMIYKDSESFISPRMRGDIIAVKDPCSQKGEIICLPNNSETHYKLCDGEMYIPMKLERGLKCVNNQLKCNVENVSCSKNTLIECKNGVIMSRFPCSNSDDYKFACKVNKCDYNE